MAVKSPGIRQARRRRTPQDARQEILDAARELIAERPFHEVTVLAIMERTTLSRKSFYVYFRDHSELIIALVRPLRAQADASLAQWAEAADPVRAGRAALRAAAGFYRQHGTIMRALFWASADDPDLAAARRDLTEPVIDAAVRAIGGHPDPQRLRATVRALVTMNQHSMLALPADATDADLDQLTDTLAAIWERAILPALPPPSQAVHPTRGRTRPGGASDQAVHPPRTAPALPAWPAALGDEHRAGLTEGRVGVLG